MEGEQGRSIEAERTWSGARIDNQGPGSIKVRDRVFEASLSSSWKAARNRLSTLMA
jgi:hypothetical protein